MKKTINTLLKTYNVSNIENAFVQTFIEKEQLQVKHNTVLLAILKDQSEETKKIKEIIKSPRDIQQLVEIFELLIPIKDRKLNGTFFTPKNITALISKEVISSPSEKICDPSCGCGAFLLTATEYIHKKFNKTIKNTIEENIYGADISEYSVRRCKILLSILSLQNKEDITPSFNIYLQDSLISPWTSKFYKVISSGGFDIVIGNPPYIKYQDMTEKTRKNLSLKWPSLNRGNYNLYFAFFELGIKILKETGKLAYIVPNSYFTSLSGINLRSFLQHNKFISKIIDLGQAQVFNAQTYTCITFLTKKPNKYFLYYKLDSVRNLHGHTSSDYSTILPEELDIKKWRLLNNSDSSNIRLIEGMPYKLKDVADIRVGIATCKDRFFFLDGKKQGRDFFIKEYQGKEYLIEKNITRAIVKISDIKNETDLPENTRRIIFPYILKNNIANIIKKEQLSKQFPMCYKYLKDIKKELSLRDKGNSTYKEWYAYARNQGLSFHGEKLLTPTFSSSPRFILDQNSLRLFCNGYAVYPKDTTSNPNREDGFSLAVLYKILNSEIMHYYITKTSVGISGGYYCYQKNFIESFGLPRLSEKELDFLQLEEDPKRINHFLKQKYHLSF